jgi:hypothetical protein
MNILIPSCAASLVLLFGCTQPLPRVQEVTNLEQSRHLADIAALWGLLKARAHGTVLEDNVNKWADSTKIGKVAISDLSCHAGEKAESAKCDYSLSVQMDTTNLLSHEAQTTNKSAVMKEIGFIFLNGDWTLENDGSNSMRAALSDFQVELAKANRQIQLDTNSKQASGWKYERDVDSMDGEITHVLSVTSVDQTNGGARLVLQCAPRNSKHGSKYNVFLATERMVDYHDSTLRFRVKFDEAPVETLSWRTLRGDMSAGTPDSSGAFTARLASSSKVMVEVPRFSAAPDVFTFQLSGNDSKFENVLQPCSKKITTASTKR